MDLGIKVANPASLTRDEALALGERRHRDAAIVRSPPRVPPPKPGGQTSSSP